jgi:AcrR family transcriptional regulator
MYYSDDSSTLVGTKKDIVDSIIQLVEKRETFDLSIKELAEGCGFTPASLYSYFESKNDLVENVKTEMERRLDGIINLPIPEKIPENMKIKMLTFYIFDFVDRNKWASDYINPFSEYESTRKLLKRIASFLEPCNRKGSGLGKDYRAYTFLAGVHFKIRYRALRKEKPTENDIEDISHFMEPRY